MTKFETIVKEMAEATGLPLELDEKDSVSVEADGVVVTVQYRRDHDDVALFAAVAEDADDATCRAALGLALHGKGTRGNFIGLFDGSIVLSSFAPLEGMTAETLGEHLLAFTDAAAAVRAELAGGSRSRATEGDVDVQSQVPPAFGSTGFMAV